MTREPVSTASHDQLYCQKVQLPPLQQGASVTLPSIREILPDLSTYERYPEGYGFAEKAKSLPPYPLRSNSLSYMPAAPPMLRGSSAYFPSYTASGSASAVGSLAALLTPPGSVSAAHRSSSFSSVFSGAHDLPSPVLRLPSILSIDSYRVSKPDRGKERAMDSRDNSDSDLSSTKKKRYNLPKKTTFILLKWLEQNLHHPYPTNLEKQQLMFETGLNAQQLGNWFINARRRKVEGMKQLV